MADLRIFVECSTKAVFDAQLEAGNITSRHLVLIKSTNQIYHNGIYYGLSSADAAKLSEVYARKEFGRVSDGTNTFASTEAEGTLTIKKSTETGDLISVEATSGGVIIKLVAATGSTNGTISLNGTEVAVAGLGSAAFTNSTAYDAAGDAQTAEDNAKAYADAITVNGKSQTSQAITVDGSDINITGYTEAASKGTLAATDTVNDALGKLEYRLDNLDLGDATAASKATFLTDTALTGRPTAPTQALADATDATKKTEVANLEYVDQAINAKMVAAQAMEFKGLVSNASGLDANALPGWTYRASAAFTVGSENVEIGDMIICTAAATTDPVAPATWSVLQNNIDGAVTGPATSVDGQIAIFDGTTGKVIKDSGFTIAKSVPADAQFTDTTYAQFAGSNPGLVPTSASADQSKFLQGDGSWSTPHDTTYTFTSGADGSFTYQSDTAAEATKVTIGKPALAGTADKVEHKLTLVSGADASVSTEFDGSSAESLTINPAFVGAAAATHTHDASEVTLMGTVTNPYSKPASVASAISSSDTLQVAIGKLEAMFDWVVYE